MLKSVLFLSILSVSYVSNSFSSDFLDSKEKKEILSIIDSQCGDTWCEGDYSYKFKSIQCENNLKSCELQFQMIEENAPKKSFLNTMETSSFIAKVSNVHEVVCEIKNISQKSGILNADKTLNESFYDTLSNCISVLEKKLR